MHNLSTIIEANRKEAVNLIKNNQGRVEFVPNIIHGSTDDSEDDWKGDANKYDLPYATVCFESGNSNLAVIAVKTDDKGDVEFLTYDAENMECKGWFSYVHCANHTENEVYMFTDEFVRTTLSKQRLMKSKCLEIMKDVNKYAEEKIDRAIKCGALDIVGAKNESYVLAKVIISAVLFRASEAYKPFLKNELADYNKLINRI